MSKKTKIIVLSLIMALILLAGIASAANCGGTTAVVPTAADTTIAGRADDRAASY